jgi:hypothetical protein
VYELIAGYHPFHRIPSTEAEEKRLRPPKLKGLSGVQWKTLARVLSFAPAERPSAKELWRAFAVPSKISQLVMNLTG